MDLISPHVLIPLADAPPFSSRLSKLRRERAFPHKTVLSLLSLQSLVPRMPGMKTTGRSGAAAVEVQRETAVKTAISSRRTVPPGLSLCLEE